jgi:hypothetical protein
MDPGMGNLISLILSTGLPAPIIFDPEAQTKSPKQ